MNKLAVSNIAWTGNDASMFDFLKNIDVQGIEVAPTKISDWENLSFKNLRQYYDLCNSFGLEIPSFQAIFFGKKDLQLLGDKSSFQQMLDHIDFVSELAASVDAKVLVFGAPRNRLLLGHSHLNVDDLIYERLSQLAATAWRNNVSIGLEAVPAVYGGEIICSYNESLKMVKSINHPGMLFHLDSGCTWLNNESIGDAVRDAGLEICHFHISQPHLADFHEPKSYHLESILALQEVNYKNWLCIEAMHMEPIYESLLESVNYIKNMYE